MFHGDGFISWKTANGLSRRDVAAINLSKVTVFFLSFLFVGIHSRPPPLRGIVRQQVDDVKTIYSQKQMYLFTAWVLYDDLRSKILLDKFHDFGYVKLRGVKVWLGRSLSIPPASSKA
jgi:hypothetical protein